ncbi:hypothetical protein CARUB_v10010797mg, partial [Capsella rubella]
RLSFLFTISSSLACLLFRIIRIMASKPDPDVIYVCGDCGEENNLKRGDVFKCRECGFRILFKKRVPHTKTKRFIAAN